MRKWAAMMLGVLALLAAPAAAQQQIPYPYNDTPLDGLRLASRDKPAEQVAAETAAADNAEAACDSGDLAGCAALGRAFLLGEGRPQNRPVAELLLRQACDGADAAGCLGLGQLFRSLEAPDMLAAGMQALGRGCRLGNLEACSAEADAVERGNNAGDGDNEAAAALRRAACAKGSLNACRALGGRLAHSDDPATATEGQVLLEATCRKGDGQSCGWAADEFRRADPPRLAEAREMASLGCEAGLPYLCRELGELLYAEETGPPEARTAALAAFDRACTLERLFCGTPEAIRSLLRLDESCRQGVDADCLMLGRLYARDDLPFYSPRDAEQIFARACFGGQPEACGAAARVLDEAGMSETAEDAARITELYTAGCEGGVDGDCETLGINLLSADPSREDRERGYALLMRACGRGRVSSCEAMENLAFDDPGAPLMTVDARYTPPLTEEEEAERARLEAEAKTRAEEEDQARRCRSSEVEFRGVVYVDRLCERPAVAITGGRPAREGEAPWQALLWRPELWNDRTLSPIERVQCGGALVRHGWILTAAHCVIDQERRLLVGSGHTFRLGVLDAEDPAGVSYAIRRVFAHQKYDEESRTYDIALVQLDTTRRLRVGGGQDIKAIPIDDVPVERRFYRAGSPAYVFGWGLTAFEGRASNVLKAAKLQIEAAETCERRTRTAGDNYLKSSLLCAKSPDRSQACNGDSGGPLVAYLNGIATVIGVVSAGTQCGETGVATRYTRVGKMLGWINDVFAGRIAPIEPQR